MQQKTVENVLKLGYINNTITFKLKGVSVMVSMKDISVACNVSIATVSKALNDYSDIGTETKEHIRQVAKELGYFPNSAAKALKTNKTKNIGVLFVDESRSGLTHDHYSYILDSFKLTAEKKGYDITFINSNKTRPSRMSYLENCKYRGFDGVAIACVDFHDPEVLELIQSDIPVVTIDHMFNERIAIMSNNIQGMHDLVSYIADRGHKKIAYIHGLDSAVTQSRLSSFFLTCEERGIEVPDEYVVEAPYRDTESAREVTTQLLQLPDPPTCIIYPDDFSALGGYSAVKQMGLRIPEDISIAGYDGIRLSRHIEPRLTTLRQDTQKIGKLAAEKLIGLIEKPKTTLHEHVVVDGEVYVGESVSSMK